MSKPDISVVEEQLADATKSLEVAVKRLEALVAKMHNTDKATKETR